MEDEVEKPDDETRTYMVGHLLIRDGKTGEVLVNQRDSEVQQVANDHDQN